MEIQKIQILPISDAKIGSGADLFEVLIFWSKVKLGFDFLGVIPNQKLQSWSLNLDFEEERNPILGSLKNSSSVKSLNFLQQKLKMPGIKFCFDKKMRPSMESYPSLLLQMDCGERPKN